MPTDKTSEKDAIPVPPSLDVTTRDLIPPWVDLLATAITKDIVKWKKC